MVRYRNVVWDSARWDGFAFRDDDIVISTPPKSGTTWLQMICALLVFGTPEFDGDLGEVSPWLDLVMQPREAVVAALEAQRHRRFIKTHTPLTGVPFDPRVSYLCVARDPRDVGISWGNHLANMDLQAVQRARDAVDLTTADDLLPAVPPPEATSRRDRFRHWMLDATPVADSGSSLRFTLHHLATFWDTADAPNVVLVHYDDLKADLPGEMRRLAQRLDITVPESAWPSLERAATFDDMREHADRLVPDSGLAKRDKKQFFHCGVSGQWAQVLGDTDLRDYSARAAELAGPDLLGWVHHVPVTVPLSEPPRATPRRACP
ncbi:sulfotransferase domain-containing protein [Pseudonocardia alaniniphila]|uniref:Sulfotransferase domain-containing protein n=1 Tax=Pseudonocardia alaniniphila TaxID=75291 RepID=A0ABS9TTR2_9PSEU|nr:sulfotransferase domain-containing protein [Pseudonocardia alaniniphila]MCH6171919.1 sulfotransferase domain-containing protein [Pseudonocardia alaniniphila]